MPKSIIYSCTRCSLTGSTFISWGNFVYLVEGERFFVKRKTGICYSCNSIVPVEIIPDYKCVTRVSKGTQDRFFSHSNQQDKKRMVKLLSRISPARCLNCGSHNFDAIPCIKPIPERLQSGTPVRTGLTHKTCGGRIYAYFSTPNFFMKDNLTERLFNIEGLEFKE